MQQFMIGPQEVGSYQTTYEHTLKIFASKNPDSMSSNSGVKYNTQTGVFTVPSLKQMIEVKYPSGDMYFAGYDVMPLWPWRLIILNHLSRADNAPFAGSFISYKETEGGSIFNSAFHRMSIQPLINTLSACPAEEVIQAGLDLGGLIKTGADICMEFPFLPRFPITIKIWRQDEEMAGSANILFDLSANHYLHTEDIAVASSTLVDFWIKQHSYLYRCGTKR